MRLDPRLSDVGGPGGALACRLGALVLLVGLLAGCAHFPLNRPLTAFDPRAGYRFDGASLAPDDELVVLLAISGGGSRAAAFAYGVLEELRRTRVGGAVGSVAERPLLDELDVISAVSGGSVVAAYYVLFGERLFDDFLPRFLERDVQGVLTRRLFAPGNWLRLMSRNFDRVDLLAEYFDHELFEGATFSDLEGKRPFLLVNATDMTRGDAFEFTQERFDPLCAELATFSVGRAVAASSSIPLVLTEVTLENHGWAACGFAPEASAGGESGAGGRRRSRWVHLQDGGLADNLGLSSLERVVMRPGGGCDRARLDPTGRRVVMIVIDAVGDLDRSPEDRKQGLSLAKTVLAAVNIPIDESSARGRELLPAQLDRWLDQSNRCAGVEEDAAERSERVYPIVLDFEAVARFDAAASGRLRRMLARFRLETDDLELLRRTGAEALRRDPELGRLLDDLAR